MKIGNGLEEGVEQGPLIDAHAVAKVEEHIQDAVGKGAKIIAGGKRHPELGGTFFEPTVLTGVMPQMAVAREETFGPLAPSSALRTNLRPCGWRTIRNLGSHATSTHAISAGRSGFLRR